MGNVHYVVRECLHWFTWQFFFVDDSDDDDDDDYYDESESEEDPGPTPAELAARLAEGQVSAVTHPELVPLFMASARPPLFLVRSPCLCSCEWIQAKMAEWDTFISRVQSWGSGGGGSAGAGAGSDGASASALSITYDMMPWIGPPPTAHSSSVALLLHDLGVCASAYAMLCRVVLITFPVASD